MASPLTPTRGSAPGPACTKFLCPLPIILAYLRPYDNEKGWVDENGINWSTFELKRAPSAIRGLPGPKNSLHGPGCSMYGTLP